MQPAGLADPVDQLVGYSRHRRDDHRDLVPGIVLALDAQRGILDALDIPDRSAAKFLHDARHDFYPKDRRKGGVSLPIRGRVSILFPAPARQAGGPSVSTEGNG